MNRLVRRVRSYPDLDIVPLMTEGLAPRDAALAWAIDQEVSRRWMTLAAVLEAHVSRAWERIEPGAQAALLTGAAQLVFMDRLPDYAVISEAVEWTKRRVRPKAGGLVNAVLRRVAEMIAAAKIEDARHGDTDLSARELPLDDGRIMVFGSNVFADDALERLAQQTSHSLELLSRWQDRFGAEHTRALALHGIIMPPTLVTDVPADAVELRSGDGEMVLSAHDEPGFHVFNGSHADLMLLVASGPACRVQDPTAAKAVTLTKALSPKVVIDLCAGRGTKTRQVAAMHPNATIIASDTSQERIKVLEQVFDGNEQVTVVAPGGLDDYAGRADVVLCDVPCSNTGVLARRSEAKYRFSAGHLRDLVKMQTSIVNRAMGLLAPGGSFVYSTCSIEEEENAGQVQASAGRHGLRVVEAMDALPKGRPGDEPSGYCDGGYAALLERTAGA